MYFVRCHLQAFFTIVAILASLESHALTIQDVPKLIQSNSHELRASEHDASAAQEEATASYGRLYPNIELKSSYTRLNDDVVIDIPAQRIEKDIGALHIGIDIDPPPVKVQDKNIYNSHLMLTQPIYAGGRITAGIDAANAKEKEARLNLEMTRDRLTIEAISRYFQAVLAEKIIGVLDRMQVDLDRMEQMANAMVSAGMAAKFSTLQIQVAKAELAARKEEAKNKSKLADLAFKTTTGMNPTMTVQYESSLRMVPLKIGLDVLKTEALNTRREFSLLDAKSDAVDALKSAQTGKMLPTVYAFGKRELLPSELTALQPLWAVGVGIDIPLTSGITAYPERKQAIELGAKVDELKSKAKHEIPLQVEALHGSVASLNASLAALSAGQEQAQEAFRLAELRFKAGSGSSLEILKAHTDLETIGIKYLLTLEEYNRKLLELFGAAGDPKAYVAAYEASNTK